MTTTTYPNKPYLNDRLRPHSVLTYDELGRLLDDAADYGVTIEGQLRYSFTKRRPSGRLEVQRYEGFQGHEVLLYHRDRKRQLTGILRHCGARECLHVKDNQGHYTIQVSS